MAVALNEIEHSKNTDFDKLSNIEAFAIFVASNKDGKLIKKKKKRYQRHLNSYFYSNNY